MNLLVGLKQGCILNLVDFGCVGAEKKWGSVVLVVLVVYHRKIRPTQLWVELSWVVAIIIISILMNFRSDFIVESVISALRAEPINDRKYRAKILSYKCKK